MLRPWWPNLTPDKVFDLDQYWVGWAMRIMEVERDPAVIRAQKRAREKAEAKARKKGSLTDVSYNQPGQPGHQQASLGEGPATSPGEAGYGTYDDQNIGTYGMQRNDSPHGRSPEPPGLPPPNTT